MESATRSARPSAAKAIELGVATVHHIRHSLGKEASAATPSDLLQGLSLALRQRLIDIMLQTELRRRKTRPKRVYYLSMEFLIGQSLCNNILNLNLQDECERVIASLGSSLEEIATLEHDAALGNGGLGRLAACFLESMATLDIAGVGCGIRYDFGLFRQEVLEGRQRERPDCWNADASPWLIECTSRAHQIPIYGHIVHGEDDSGAYNPMWLGWKLVTGVPYDMPIVGYGGHTVNRLRLYAARASDSFDMDIFNAGDYMRAVEQKIASENISRVLYPSDSFAAGKELRLIQEYFLVACSLRDIVADFIEEGVEFKHFPERVAIQMNDTHPALAVVELMRVFLDEQGIAWDEAWALTRRTLAYTNHTLLPEALEKWAAELLQRVLPRHLQLIYEINRRFLAEVAARWPGDLGRLARMSLFEEGDVKEVRMANLAIVGSHSVNGVAALHSHLLQTRLVPDFQQLDPARFGNKTNGVTPRRWIQQANPSLAALFDDVVGTTWRIDMERLRDLEKYVKDAAFLERVTAIKRANKLRLAQKVYADQRLKLDPESIFDIQSKRMHEYKRQLLHALHVVHCYLNIVEDGADLTPRTHVFAGKAAPGYFMAKRIVELINAIAGLVNSDPRVDGRLRVVFVPDYKVSVAEWLIPAADLSEQISTAGMEASGTGNMKFAMNGALTVGTHDGANIEMAEEIGVENLYLFGLRAEQVEALQRSGAYDPVSLCATDPQVRRVLDSLVSGVLHHDLELFRPIRESLLDHDTYFVLADFADYVATHERASRDFVDAPQWTRRCVYNIARSGKFSSDRTIREYAQEIWSV